RPSGVAAPLARAGGLPPPRRAARGLRSAPVRIGGASLRGCGPPPLQRRALGPPAASGVGPGVLRVARGVAATAAIIPVLSRTEPIASSSPTSATPRGRQLIRQSIKHSHSRIGVIEQPLSCCNPSILVRLHRPEFPGAMRADLPFPH